MAAREQEQEQYVAVAPTFPWVAAVGFVLVWSSGYIAGPAGVDAVEPFTLLAARFALATALLVPLTRWLRGPLRIDRDTLLRVCAVGLVMNALQFGLMYLAFEAGLGATLGALVHSLSPVLTVVLAGVLLGEGVRPIQVVGLVVGVAGVLLVLGPEVDAAGGPLGVTLALLSMLSLSLGTLGQRWIHTTVDPWWSACLQFAVCIPPMLVLAVALESNPVHDPVAGGIALAYLAIVNSIVGLMLLGAVVRRGGAGASSSVFFLMPPVTAVMAWLVLGETLGARELVGLVVAITGVAVATLRPRRNPVAPENPAG